MNRALVLLAASCGGGASAVPAGSQLGPALAAALEGAELARTPWRCAAADGPVLADEKVTLGERTWTAEGSSLRADGKADIVIGAVADAGDAEPATLAALGRLRTRLAGADLVIALGGMGATQAQLEATLGVLADKASFAVVALPGDLEPAGAQRAAIKTLRTRGQFVIDGRLARWIELPGVTIGAVAGAGAQGRLAAGPEGCGYRPEDVTAVLSELTRHPTLRILASAEAPREPSGDEPSGMLVLTPGAGQQLDIALHGPSSEAPSRARSGHRDGDAVPLTPGTIDATPRLPGPVHVPSAGLLSLHGSAWSWKPIMDSD